ncbi:hypothetical protein ACF07Q_05010 [Nocardiopsis dassonvillei]|uniref:hypothetical protein n=1 Tax=Nocardiopsis dassonvillei TaxID=2014 RepID=UPI0036F81738
MERVAGQPGSGTGGDDGRAWDARLGWAYGLTADDPAERAAALLRLAEARENVRAAVTRFNEWLRTPAPGGREGYRKAEYLKAYAPVQESQGYLLPDALWNRPRGDVRAWPGLPYALLYLEWEAKYPREWTRHAKKWGTKERLVRDVAVAGHDEAVRARLSDLVETVVRRRYRCKDREYVRVARVLDGEDLRARLTAAAGSDHPWARRHAAYVLWLLDRPGVPNTRSVWRTWNTEEFRG